MKYILPLGLAIGCSQSSVNPGKNLDPEATITSHADGDQVFADELIEFRATVTDDNNNYNELEVEWRIDDQVVCPYLPPDDDMGTSTCSATMSEGESAVKVTVRDPQNAVGVTSIALTVIASEPPVAEITAPTGGEVFSVGDPISFSGIITDSEDAASDLVAGLSSDLSGDLGITISPDTNGVFTGSTATLPAGLHTVTLTVEDQSNKTATDTVQFTVNTDPTCQFTFPTNGDYGDQGELVIFAGTVSDPDTSPTDLTIEFASSVDGAMGTAQADSNGNVSFAYADLTSATHTVSMTVTDSHGAQCISNVIYSVGSPPQVEITQPASGSIVNAGEFLSFAATVSDNEDQGVALSVEWESSIDGVLFTLNPDLQGVSEYSTSSLSNGEHAISAKVTDSDGLYGIDTIFLSVKACPPCLFGNFRNKSFVQNQLAQNNSALIETKNVTKTKPPFYCRVVL